MKYKLVGVTMDAFQSRKVIMTSSNLSILKNMKSVVSGFGFYSSLRIEKA